jgi:chromosome segregation ATPase
LNINLLRHENGFRYGLSEPRYDDYVSISEDDRDELIKELLAEAHGLRMKNEQISLYTESKIGELVKLQRELLTIRDGFETVVEQRNDLEVKLALVNTELEHLGTIYTAMTDQRDRLRGRVAKVETSRAFRIGQRIIRFVPFLKERENPAQ